MGAGQLRQQQTGAVQDWAPFTSYAALQPLRAPDGSLVRALAQHTSGAVYDQTLYLYIAGKGVVGYAEATTSQAAISGVTDLTGLSLPSFTINAGDPAIWVTVRVAYWTATVLNGAAALSFVRNEDSTIWGTTFSSPAYVANGQCAQPRVSERLTTPGTYTLRARGQQAGAGGTVTMNASARIRAYILAQREV